MSKLVSRFVIALVVVFTVFMVSGSAGDFPTGTASHAVRVYFAARLYRWLFASIGNDRRKNEPRTTRLK